MDNMPDNNSVTATETQETPVTENVQAEETPAASTDTVTEEEKHYTKDDVVHIMKKRLARLFKKYGVENQEGLDELYENSKKYGQMNDEFGKIQLKNSELMRENAFLRNNINPDKYQDIIAFFKGNDLEFSEEELLKQLPTHSEWLKQTAPATTIKSLGSEAHTMPKPNEADLAGKLLGVNF